MEIWKDIPDYEGHYQVSNLGNVKSTKLNNQKLLKPYFDSGGYFIISLYKNFTKKTFLIHKLVAMAFLNHKNFKDTKLVIDHINNIKNDNRLENLQLITTRFNSSKDKKGYTSKYVGVSWDKQKNKWRSSIDINGKKKHIGLFKCELKAAFMYKEILKQLNY
jgi:hypothetical protein